jgi:4,5-DOPA dioxygenase extradiol
MQPSFFVPHGSPVFALEAGEAGTRLAQAAAALPEQPRAIVVASAHWDTATPTVGAAERPETIHDFWGFPDALYKIRYAAPGAPKLARAVADHLQAAGFAADLAATRGLDHAVWIPLRLMFPNADIPVVPLSIQSDLGPKHHYRLGQALAPLLADNVLVIGSGNLTHNLRDVQSAKVSRGVTGGNPRGSTAPESPYVGEFAEWMWQRIEADDIDALLDYRRLAPDAQRAHPAEDHLLPLFVALGAAGQHRVARRIHTGIDYHVLAMDAYAFHPHDGAAP